MSQTPARPDIPVDLLDGQTIGGSQPIVLIGPNGSGKSRLGVTLARRRGYDRIPALRSLNFGASIPYQKQTEAMQEADNQINQGRNSSWQMANELSHVLSELKAEDSQSAIEFRDKAETDVSPGKPVVTRLKTLLRLWHSTFPGRVLDLSTYDPKAKWVHADRVTESYAANEMSDGERAALYLISRVLRANAGVVIVDEPEVHFHALLARSFWDTIEAERQDCRFVYITHDLPFALSRAGAQIGIVRSVGTVSLLPDQGDIPAEIYEAILGATSLSVVAKRIVFCEGDQSTSADVRLYRAWFQSTDTVVVPVGNCRHVQQAVEVFSSNPVIANASSVGLVERDYWPDEYLTKLSNAKLHILPTHEVEGLLCLRAVAAAVAAHQAVKDFDPKYAAFETAVRKRFKGLELNKQILERAKCDFELQVIGASNKAFPHVDAAATKAGFTNTIVNAKALSSLGAIFDKHATTVTDALNAGAEKFLAILPGKDCLPLLCYQLGITTDRYIELVSAALSQSGVAGDKGLKKLSRDLVAALKAHLPKRSAT